MHLKYLTTVSVGTGKRAESLNWGRYPCPTFFQGILYWLAYLNIFSIHMEGTSAAFEILPRKVMGNGNFFRLQPILADDLINRMDDIRHIKRLKAAGKQIVSDNFYKRLIKKIAKDIEEYDKILNNDLENIIQALRMENFNNDTTPHHNKKKREIIEKLSAILETDKGYSGTIKYYLKTMSEK